MKTKPPTFEPGLAALLDALTAELLAAPDWEVENGLHESGAKGRAATEAVRLLMTAADPATSLLPACEEKVRMSGLGMKPQ